MPTFAEMMTRHPEYREKRWREMDLFHRGGVDLLDAIQEPAANGFARGEELLIRRYMESETQYGERCRRAYCLPLTGTVVGFFAAATLSDPPAITEAEPEITVEDLESEQPAETPDKGGAVESTELGEAEEGAGGASAPDAPDGEKAKAPAPSIPEPEPKSWYEAFSEDVDRAGTDLAEFLRLRLVDALVFRAAYALVDFPVRPEDAMVQTRLDEDREGLREGYFVPVRREQILDWERDASGRLVWANVLFVTRPRDTFDARRDTTRYEWRVIETDPVTKKPRIRLFRLEHKTGKGEAPDPKALVEEVGTIEHRSGEFPLVEMLLPEGLWVASKVHPAERELLNKQNAKSWYEYQCAYAFLVAQLVDPDAVFSKNFTDGVVKTVRPEENISWRELSGTTLERLKDAIVDLVEAICRAANQLALAAPLGAVAQAASGEAKRRDQQPGRIVCAALASSLRDFALALFGVLKSGRGEEVELEVSGLRRFDDADRMLEWLQAGIADKIRSDRAQVEIQKRALDEVLPDLSPSLRAEIEAELEKGAKLRAIRREALTKAAVENPEAMVGAAGAPMSPAATVAKEMAK